MKKVQQDNYLDSMDLTIREILAKLTTQEKFDLLAGFRFFQTKPIKRLGIKTLKMTDGPFGISMHSSLLRRNTKFPGGINIASTWNRKLTYEMGEAIGKEARAVGRHLVLAPSMNINRTPLNGRTFEYFSEDPYLTKEIAIPYVQGIQDQKVAACPKHFVANNQENHRYIISAEMSERTLNEIYLRPFKQVVEEVDPWSFMTSYNMVNGEYMHTNEKILKSLLMDKWGFSGFVMTDWFATSLGFRKLKGEPISSPDQLIKSGLSLEMPKSYIYNKKRLLKALSNGFFTQVELDFVITRLLRVLYLTGRLKNKISVPRGERNTSRHQRLARTISEEGMVLLKNENNLLPINFSKVSKIAILGPNAEKKFGKLLYGGSSAVKPPYEITTLKGIKEKIRGRIKITSNLIEADIVLLVMGLNHNSEVSLVRDSDKINNSGYANDSEGADRESLRLPIEQVKLINNVASINPNCIVILINGSPITMDDWIQNVPVVLEAWYPGMEGGRAIANILFGDANPSGKLPITFPKFLRDSPAHKSKRNYPGENLKVYYDEGVFVGYRYFDQFNIKPLFPFGYGLSYTDFEINMIEKQNLSINHATDQFYVKVEVRNLGERTGSEVIQIYSHDKESTVKRPLNELVAFEKVLLKPKEKKIVEMNVKTKDLAFYDEKTHSWKKEKGVYLFNIGNSSRNFILETEINLI